MGISPDLIVLRCDEPLEPAIFEKIALFCNVTPDCVVEKRTIPILYEAPLMLEEWGFSRIVCRGPGLCGLSPDGHIVEAVELPEKRFFVGVQFHPEFKSRPNRPHPLFLGPVRASLED